MSERERWIVYPLLLLALGSALRDKLFSRTATPSVVCESLRIVPDSRYDSGFHELISMGPHRVEGRLVGGVLRVAYIEAEAIRVGQVVADNYIMQGVPISPLGRITVPISPADLYKMLRQAEAAKAKAGESAKPLDDRGADADNLPDGEPAEDSAPANPPADGG